MVGEGVLEGALGTALLWRRWEADHTRAALLLIHGLGEHSGRYEPPASYWARKGISVVSFDLRGHGRSGGPRGDVDAFPRWIEDVLRVEQELLDSFPAGVPRFLLGHSLGGLIALRRIQLFPGPYRGVILSAPWLATRLPPWVRSVARLLGLALPSVRWPAGFGPEKLTRDEAVASAWRADPLVHTRLTGRLFREVERVQAEVLEAPAPKGVPLLFLLPTDDRVVRGEVTQAYAEGIVKEGGRLEILEGFRHEPLNDLGRERVFDLIVEWITGLAEEDEPGASHSQAEP